MTTPTAIDRDAPVVSHHETEIAAPLDVVWRLHVEVNTWPIWQTDVTEAHLDGAFEEGASFDWSSYGFPVTSTIYNLSERSRVLWEVPPAGSPASTNGSSVRHPAAPTWRPTSHSQESRSKPTRPGCKPCSTGR